MNSLGKKVEIRERKTLLDLIVETRDGARSIKDRLESAVDSISKALDDLDEAEAEL